MSDARDAAASSSRDWIDYYDSAHMFYVNARHRDVHFQIIADDIIAMIPSADATVLDYSCGEALAADRVAAACAQLILVEPAPSVRARLAARFGDHPRIAIRSLEDIAALPAHSVDLVTMNSVAQYLTPDELDATLVAIRRLLKPTGRFVLGDVLDPRVGMFADAWALIVFGAKHGFLIDALIGLVRTALSDYWHLRQRIGLTRYAPADIIARLVRAGFSAARAPVNFGHNQRRMTFVATPCAS